MISCIEWVPKGVADPTPKKYEMSAVELELLENQAKMEAAMQEGGDDDDDDSDASEGEQKSSSIKLPKIDPSTLPADLRMDEYSDDDDDEAAAAAQGSMLGHMLVGHDNEMIGNRLDEEGMPVEDIAEEDEEPEDEELDDEEEDSDDNEEDDDDLADVPDTREYMPVDISGLAAMGISHHTQALNDDDEDDDDDDSDIDDINLSPEDAILVLAKTEDDFAALEVHVYEEKTGNLFVHHDIPLPAFPLCLAHGDINHEGGAGNYIAVGTFEPGIEVWNLDVLNVLEPTCILGGEDTSAADELMKANMVRAATGKKLKKRLSQDGGGLRPGSHTDAVMALSWNKIHRQVIASGSADNTVKIWDITKTDKQNVATFTHHKNNVQAVEWHPSEGTLLATGSYDRTVSVVDARDQNSSKSVKITADCEALTWDPHHSQYLTAATEDGIVSCWDVRKFDKPVWSLVAEEYGGVTDLSYNPNVPGMLATCAINKTVTLWDTYSKDQQQPSGLAPVACGNKSMEVGKLYTLSFYRSSTWLLGCGGSGNELSLWDMTREDVIQKRFGDRVGQKQVQQEQEEESTDTNKEQDFEAMMAAGDGAMEKIRENKAKKNNKKKGKKKKKGAHKG